MKPHQLNNTLVSLVAVFVGVVTAVAIKLSFSSHEEAPESNEAKMAQLREAGTDPLYLADMREVNDDFAFDAVKEKG